MTADHNSDEVKDKICKNLYLQKRFSMSSNHCVVSLLHLIVNETRISGGSFQAKLILDGSF